MTSYSSGLIITKITIMLVGFIIFLIGIAAIVKSFMPELLGFLPSNPIVYYALTAFFGLALIFYASKHL